MRTLIAGILILAGLTGCAAKIPFEGDRSRDRIAQDLKLAPTAIVRQDRCVVGRYDGTGSTRTFECIYIATGEYAALLDFDATANQFREAIRIGKPDAVAYVTRGSIAGTLAQMQVRHDGERYAVEFVNADLGQIGHQDDLRAAYDHLRSIGIAEAEPLPYVMRRQPPAPIIIPIYIPR
jgi:hypothetical protein